MNGGPFPLIPTSSSNCNRVNISLGRGGVKGEKGDLLGGGRERYIFSYGLTRIFADGGTCGGTARRERFFSYGLTRIFADGGTCGGKARLSSRRQSLAGGSQISGGACRCALLRAWDCPQLLHAHAAGDDWRSSRRQSLAGGSQNSSACILHCCGPFDFAQGLPAATARLGPRA